MRAAIYARVSTVRQAEGDLSIPDQKRQIAAYCQQRGWVVVAEYVDAGASATSDDRPEFQRMVDDGTATKVAPFDVIVVHSYSRYFRDSWQAELYRRRLKKHGVDIVSVTQGLGDGPTADLVRQIIGLMDEHQSKENAKHTLRGMEENARQGFVNGIAPFGYRSVPVETRGAKVKRRLAIEPGEAEIVKLMFDLAHHGAAGLPMGMKEIAKALNARNLRTRAGRRFTTSAVHAILRKPTYAGRHLFNQFDSKMGAKKPAQKHIVVVVPAIVDEATFEAVQRRLAARDPKKAHPHAAANPTLLSKLARCAACGGAMSLRTGKFNRYRYYTCSTARRQGPCGCAGRTIREDLLDGLVTSHLSDLLFAPDRLRDLFSEFLEAERRRQKDGPRLFESLTAQRADIDNQIARMHIAIQKGLVDLDDADFAARLRGLREQRADLIRRIERAQAERRPFAPISTPKLARLGDQLRRGMAAGDMRARRAYVRVFVDRIEVDDREIRLRGPKSALVNAIAGAAEHTAGEVLPLVERWRPRRDSNARPQD